MNKLLACFLLITSMTVQAQPQVQWKKRYPATDIAQTKDGGYILIGDTIGSTFAAIVVTKTDSLGVMSWQRIFNGNNSDFGKAVAVTSDGGYVVMGAVWSSFPGAHGRQDIWIAKLNSAGTTVWEKCYGGTNDELAANVLQVADGGYVFAGSTKSNDGDISGNHGKGDIWLVKISATGQLQWQHCYGGPEYDYGWFVEATTDGGYLITGSAGEAGGNNTAHYGGKEIADGWLLKTNSVGAIQWQKNYGGTKNDWLYCARQTKEGDFIVLGNSESKDYDVKRPDTASVLWAFKTNSIGNIIWSKTYVRIAPYNFNPYANLLARDLIQAYDGNYIVAITKDSPQDSIWFSSLDTAGNIKWAADIVDKKSGKCGRLIQTTDSGFIIGTVKSAIKLKVFKDTTPHPVQLQTVVRSEEAINIYPNPSSGAYYLQVPPAWTDANIAVMDIAGRVINVLVTDEGDKKKLQLPPTLSGLYILTINTGKGIYTHKLLCQP